MERLPGSLIARASLSVTLAVLPGLSHADEAVVRYETPDGQIVEIDIDTGFPGQTQRLVPGKLLRAGVPVLHSSSGTKIQVASLVRGDKLTVWQLNKKTFDRPHAIRATIRMNRATPDMTPGWWPALLKPWSRRATDRYSTTTTLLGWSVASLSSTRMRIQNAAARAGLVASDTVNSKPSKAITQQDELLFFTGQGQEMMVTLSRFGHRIGVVAHLTEVRR